MQMISAKFAVFCTLVLSGCSSLPYEQGVMPKAALQSQNQSFETGGPVNARDFLPPQIMQSHLHRVDERAYNDGYMNTYRIVTPDHAYVVQGTNRAIAAVTEIHAIARLQEISTTGTAFKGAKERTLNLVETPIRAGTGIYDRFARADGTEEALMVVPSGLADISGHLANGLGELLVTGKRIAFSAAGTKCDGISGCAAKAGEDIWSGFNSVVGKHNAARELHERLGTDPHSDNKVLQREIDRVAYADAYPSTAVKIGYTWSGVPILDPLATGVGYYNNGEFAAAYEDAHKSRALEKDMLRSWGAPDETIDDLYRNEAFTHTSRTQLLDALSQISTADYRARLARDAASSKTRTTAQSRLLVYNYLADLERERRTQGYVTDLEAVIMLDKSGTLILPFAADYLRLTPIVDRVLQRYSQLAQSHSAYRTAQIHIIGTASGKFVRRAESLGINVQMPQ